MKTYWQITWQENKSTGRRAHQIKSVNLQSRMELNTVCRNVSQARSHLQETLEIVQNEQKLF
jgi:hypothetical protein